MAQDSSEHSAEESPGGPARVLVITAHPDDVAYCIVTDGDAGGIDASISRADMAQVRRAEQCRAAEVLGVTEIEFLGRPDGRVVADLALRRDLTRVIRRYRPTRVVTQSPLRDLRSMYASHPDHIAVGEAAMCAVYPDARNEFAHSELLQEEGLPPHTVPETWVMAPTGDGDHAVDITAVFDRKMAALWAHVSQTAHLEDLDARIRAWGAAQAMSGKLGPGRLAESFHVLDTR